MHAGTVKPSRVAVKKVRQVAYEQDRMNYPGVPSKQNVMQKHDTNESAIYCQCTHCGLVKYGMEKRTNDDNYNPGIGSRVYSAAWETVGG